LKAFWINTRREEMLKNVPKNINPELLKILCEMGHTDEIVIADGNFPGTSLAQNIIRCDSTAILPLLESVLKLFPLDHAEKAVMVMAAGSEIEGDPEIWREYREVIKKYEDEKHTEFLQIERHKFYERAKKSYAIVMTNDGALYANIILKKGIIKSL